MNEYFVTGKSLLLIVKLKFFYELEGVMVATIKYAGILAMNLMYGLFYEELNLL